MGHGDRHQRTAIGQYLPHVAPKVLLYSHQPLATHGLPHDHQLVDKRSHAVEPIGQQETTGGQLGQESMGQGPFRLLRQTQNHRQGSVRAQFDQPAHRQLGKSRLEAAANRLAQVPKQLRGVAHAGLTAVDRHQPPAPIKRVGLFPRRGQWAQRRPHDRIKYSHSGRRAPLAQVAVRNLHAGQLFYMGRQGANPA